MNKYYCPHCGFANNPNSHFCRHCGFDLSKYKERLQNHNRGAFQQSKPNINVSRSQVPPQSPLRRPVNYGPRPYPPRHHHFVSGLLSIIAIVILIFAGIGAYSNNVWPFGSGPIGQIMGQNSRQSASPNNNNSQSSNSSNSGSSNNDQNSSNDGQSYSSDYTPIRVLWKHVNNKLNSDTSDGGSTEIDNLFQNSDDNSSLDGIKDWLNLMVRANSNNDTEVTDIKPYDFSSNNGEIHYKVRYDFKLHAHSSDAYHHIQIFDWHATVQNGKIGLMKSPKTPTEDYKE